MPRADRVYTCAKVDSLAQACIRAKKKVTVPCRQPALGQAASQLARPPDMLPALLPLVHLRSIRGNRVGRITARLGLPLAKER